MKRRVLGKTAPFHLPFMQKKKKEKKKKQKWCRFERHHMSSSSPGRAKQGKKKIFFLPLFSTAISLSKRR
jgi:hypothetical protein